MAKYKICPDCGRLNPTNALDCECGTDLSEIHVSDEAFAPQRTETSVRMVRICEACHAQNPPSARKCRCGEDISDISPVPESSVPGAQAAPEVASPYREQMERPVRETWTAPAAPVQVSPKNYMLSSLDGDLLYQISEGETVLGREAELADYLEKRLYVSRRHAALRLEGDRLTIENLRATNMTFVNNRSLGDQAVELHEGDEIGLGGNSVGGSRQDRAAYFRVVRK
ncbi:MAG: FHA domain-containing protein [Clostridia bacterium]|nr:FHA domain-containing protein [Clostridia bacterium]